MVGDILDDQFSGGVLGLGRGFRGKGLEGVGGKGHKISSVNGLGDDFPR